MKTFKELLIELNACEEAIDWADDMPIEEVVEKCHRGDWLLWLAQKVDIGLQPLTLAKGHCANTVRHLMKDQRSVKAVDVAIAFGEGKATEDELRAAVADAADATTAYAAYVAADAITAYAAYAAADAVYAAAYADAYAADSYAATYAADSYAAVAYANSRAKNRKQTADICRKYIGELIIQKVNEMLNDRKL